MYSLWNVANGAFPIVMTIAQVLLIIWAIIDIINRKLDNKSLWVVVILGIPVIGALGYLISGRSHSK